MSTTRTYSLKLTDAQVDRITKTILDASWIPGFGDLVTVAMSLESQASHQREADAMQSLNDILDYLDSDAAAEDDVTRAIKTTEAIALVRSYPGCQQMWREWAVTR